MGSLKSLRVQSTCYPGCPHVMCDMVDAGSNRQNAPFCEDHQAHERKNGPNEGSSVSGETVLSFNEPFTLPLPPPLHRNTRTVCLQDFPGSQSQP